MPEIHSTGRGGAGNIGPEADATYVDGGIVREGPAGQAATAGEFSTGRGGAGNIEPGLAPQAAKEGRHMARSDDDVVPESATRDRHQDVFHTGRGGQGNVHKDKYGGHSKPQSGQHMAQAHAAGSESAAGQAGAAKKEQHGGVGEKVKHLFEKKH